MSSEFDNIRQTWVLPSSHIHFNNTIIFLGPLAVILNAILLVNFCIRRRNLKQGHFILINMCISDFISSCSVCVSSIWLAISGQVPWELCQSVGMVVVTATTVSGISALFLSVERYFMIVHSSPFSSTILIIGIIFIWILSTLFGSMAFITETYYHVRPSAIWRFPEITKLTSRHLPFAIMAQVLVWTALLTIPWCYWKIYKFAISYGFKWGLQKGAVTAALGASTSTLARCDPSSN
ncbi:hypothetical protein BKA69DRAFT_1089058 [Paraphysoderma sedebokerense]|nr:hypothetical protein BKA69DRAFT_1089058 [Paraphysoderma sedebokerense]